MNRERNESNLELIDAVLGGNISKYGELVGRYEKMIYTLAFLKLQNKEAAVTVSQKCFIQAYKELASCRSEESFPATVYRICGSLIKKHLKVYAGNGTAQIKISNTTNSEFVRDALMAMPENCREVIVLRDIGGLRCEHIAELLGIDIKTVRNITIRVRTELRNAMLKESNLVIESMAVLR